MHGGSSPWPSARVIKVGWHAWGVRAPGLPHFDAIWELLKRSWREPSGDWEAFRGGLRRSASKVMAFRFDTRVLVDVLAFETRRVADRQMLRSYKAA